MQNWKPAGRRPVGHALDGSYETPDALAAAVGNALSDKDRGSLMRSEPRDNPVAARRRLRRGNLTRSTVVAAEIARRIR